MNFAISEPKYLSFNQEITWGDARQECLNMGRFLMEFSSEEEYDKAIQLAHELGYGFWLGGNDFQQEGVWIWERNGEEIDMDQLWVPEEPNGGARENCLEINQVGVNDLVCGDNRRFVCVLY